MPRHLLALMAAALCAGCQFGTPPDPNDPRMAGIKQPEILRRSLKGASDALLQRVANGEIDDAEYKKQIAVAANEILRGLDIGQIPPSQAWEYGEIFRTARRWEEARSALETAVRVAKNEDRRVNDSLRLAVVYGELGRYKRSIDMARSVLNAPDNASAPILPAVLLEIAPVLKGHGVDEDLATLLEEAIRAENRTIIDPTTQPGKDFLIAKPFHVRNAFNQVIELYRSLGKNAMAEKASIRANEILSRQTGI